MTTNSTTIQSTSAFTLPLSGLWANLMDKLAKRKVYVETLRELQSLSDHELSDIGLNRWDLQNIALEAAYGK